MTPFTRLTAVAALLPRGNVDTDAIIPSREMRSVSRKGLADGLFAGWRYTDVASRRPDPDFVLNRPACRGAQILVSGANFGCGSSREHAVWALAEFGFRAVIATSFAPIFQANCIANGVLPAVVSDADLAEIGTGFADTGPVMLTLDLDAQRVSGTDDRTWHFEIDGQARIALLEGLDTVASTLLHLDAIEAFRAADAISRPWIYAK